MTVDVAEAVTRALQRAGISQKVAAATMGIDAGQLSRQMRGIDGNHLSMQRLLLLPASFWREFLPALAEPAQLAVTHEDLAEIALKQVGVAVENLTRGISTLLTLRRTA